MTAMSVSDLRGMLSALENLSSADEELAAENPMVSEAAAKLNDELDGAGDALRHLHFLETNTDQDIWELVELLG